MLNKKEIIKWLKEMDITDYTINQNNSVDVHTDVDINHKKLKEIPIQFNKISGDFYCDTNQLTSLQGCPHEIGGAFWCDTNQLTSLQGCPHEISGDFYCHNNLLTSLQGCPQEIGGDFYCDNNLKNTREYKLYLMKKKLRELCT